MYRVEENWGSGGCGYTCKTTKEVYDAFKKEYMETNKVFQITETHFEQKEGILAKVTFVKEGQTEVVEAKGNGRLNAVNNAVKQYLNIGYTLDEYEEHALSKNSSSNAMAYVGITQDNQKLYWGAGTDSDIIKASIQALENAVNRMLAVVQK